MAAQPPREVLGAYHVALLPGWRDIGLDQCRRIRSSGLLSRTSRLLVGVVGDPGEDLSPLVGSLGDVAEVRRPGPLHAYEFPTLQWLHDEARAGDHACWYVHTKGASVLHLRGAGDGIDGATGHRLRMEALVLDNHAACLEVLDGHDACGGGWQLDGFGHHRPHFSGDFWWANSRYLATLPPPASLDRLDRYQAEFWVGSGPSARPFAFEYPSDPFARPSAWAGLEGRYRDLLGDPGPVRRVVDLGMDCGFSTFHFARDFPEAEVVGVDDFTLHPDAEGWVRAHLNLFPNLRIVKGPTAEVGRAFAEPVDLLHVDADHRFEAVAEDFCAWLHAARPDGRVLFHDTVTFPSVGRSFAGLGGVKREIPDHHGLGCWIK